MKMHLYRPFSPGKCLAGLLLAAWTALFGGGALAQAPAASGSATQAIPAEQLDKLVAPIALYPDDLVAIILPAATFPVQIVQADRLLEKRKTDKNLKINEGWDDSVKSLANYPEVIKKMSTELDWTTELGEAVVADQEGILDAIQRFRRKTQSAGNLKSDEKQKVVVEKETITIVPANPEVIYVPQYNPTTVVVSGGYTTWGYYPSPYPVYYYPYPPGAAFATGLIWGAAIGAAWNGGRYATHWEGGGNTININRNTNIQGGNRVSNQPSKGTAWRSDKKPGEVSHSSGRGNTAQNRVGDAQGSRGGSGQRPQTADRSAGQRGGDAFGSYGSGREARADSSRGASSRESMSSGNRSAQPTQRSSGGYSGGGGARASAGGGGARAGGGGGRSGGGRAGGGRR